MTAEDWLPTIEIYLPEQFDEIRTAIERLQRERDSIWRNYTELVHDFLPDFLGCLPSCDSYGHAEDCPAVEPLAAQKRLLEDLKQAQLERDRLTTENASLKATLEREIDLCKRVMGERDQSVQQVGRLREAVRENSIYLRGKMVYCHFCQADAPTQNEIEHAADCIVRECEPG